jgi:hypothetical protein
MKQLTALAPDVRYGALAIIGQWVIDYKDTQQAAKVQALWLQIGGGDRDFIMKELSWYQRMFYMKKHKSNWRQIHDSFIRLIDIFAQVCPQGWNRVSPAGDTIIMAAINLSYLRPLFHGCGILRTIISHCSPSLINTRDRHGRTAFLQLCEGCVGYTDVQLLIERKADLNLCDNTGTTPVWAAFNRRNVYLAKVLVREGADVSVTNNKGVTAQDAMDRWLSCISIKPTHPKPSS